MVPFLEGIALGASLIIAIGPQNAFVIQQGILRQHVFLAAFVCTFVDVVLIIVGAAGFGTLIAIIPSLKTYFLWGGILFLMGYGTLSLISSFKDPGDEDSLGKNKSGYSTNRKSIIITAAGFSLLNPHVYLDTVILLGGLAAQYDIPERNYFAFGAIMASVAWFYGIGYGANLVAPWFESSRGKRILELVIAMIMFVLAFVLMLNVLD
ncbi:MAG: LysE/ArgO family amino acid transporter [SAR324 cluster bacterium]|nr:LysE/ArgO family amino acid transporter [SAR324 cluster bacterium]